MPIYDYKCQKCGEITEILITSPLSNQNIICPVCGSKELRKLVSASYILQTESRASGKTCCGRAERCETPPCSQDSTCRRDGK